MANQMIYTEKESKSINSICVMLAVSLLEFNLNPPKVSNGIYCYRYNYIVCIDKTKFPKKKISIFLCLDL